MSGGVAANGTVVDLRPQFAAGIATPETSP